MCGEYFSKSSKLFVLRLTELTLKLCGNSDPPMPSQMISAWGPAEDVQATEMESPGRRKDREGSNFRCGRGLRPNCWVDKATN